MLFCKDEVTKELSFLSSSSFNTIALSESSAEDYSGVSTIHRSPDKTLYKSIWICDLWRVTKQLCSFPSNNLSTHCGFSERQLLTTCLSSLMVFYSTSVVLSQSAIDSCPKRLLLCLFACKALWVWLMLQIGILVYNWLLLLWKPM